jgi:HPt (histidine-containing phosphotransfer) domain-containing protein
MGGMTSLYLLAASEFVHTLDSAALELRTALAAGDWAAAVMQMHTLKGTSATLGAGNLSRLASEWEIYCKSRKSGPPAEHSLPVSLPDSPAMGALDTRLQTTRTALLASMALLEEESRQETSADNAHSAEHGIQGDAHALDAALAELLPLLAASDLTALEKFAEWREAFSGVSPTLLVQLEDALQGLDLARGQEVCLDIKRSLDATTP